ncbi:MAG: hydantoinase/oxoprolinase family protein [Desulfarculaceae bacterium]|nr:hydantoinase/oxoprolinase family protein [Desulfarculaceae bacterium]
MIIGLDVGGTHTDAVLLSNRGFEKKVKVPTETANLFNTVLTGIQELLADTSPEKIKRIVLSTTLTTNAVVRRNTTPAGTIVSSGPGINPESFRTDSNYHVVKGSIDHRGREKESIDENEIEKIAETLEKKGIEYVAVIGKFSVRNPSHEILIKRILNRRFKKIFLGHHVSGNLNFPRRIATTYLNAVVYGMHKDFFTAVKDSLEQMGIKAPIMLLKADGGTMNLDASMEYPGQTILSGPAASIMGAIPHAAAGKDTLVLDIGGTTTDISILVDKTPILEPVGIRRGVYKSLIRSLKTYSEAIGGDSVVRADNGSLTVGPERLGPAMAFDGPAPTPTDAVIHLGIMETGDRDKARSGMERIAESLGVSPDEAAESIFKRTCEIILENSNKMVDRINSKPVYTVHEFLEGYRIKPESILLLGGPAEYFAPKIEELSGIETTAVPCSSVANAIGAALARTTCEVSLTVDTEQGTATAHEEDYAEPVDKSFTGEDAVKCAYSLLQQKAAGMGADEEEIENVEVIEYQSFNIVRNFSPRGKIFKTKIQIKPGPISGFETICEKIKEM